MLLEIQLFTNCQSLELSELRAFIYDETNVAKLYRSFDEFYFTISVHRTKKYAF